MTTREEFIASSPSIAVLWEHLLTVADRIHTEAQNRDWCSEYDCWQQEINARVGFELLIPRSVAYSFRFQATVPHGATEREVWDTVVEAIQSEWEHAEVDRL